jgi:hypothetical protein
VNDVNIFIYEIITQRNCETLKRIHVECETWAKRYGSKFNSKKYHLIYFTRRSRRFQMDEGLKIEERQIMFEANIRVLRVQLDLTLRWKAHLREVKAKATRILSAFGFTIGSI